MNRRRTVTGFAGGLLALFLVAAPGPARAAAALVADLSEDVIHITTGFTGTRLLLFGAVEAPGDVIIVVRGPREEVVVRRKERRLGLWVNGPAVTFTDAPAYYAVAASDRLGGLLSQADLVRYEAGHRSIRMTPADDATNRYELVRFHNALSRNRAAEGLYVTRTRPVEFVGERLFRADLDFPANVPVGNYTVTVMLIRDGAVVDEQKSILIVDRTGPAAWIFERAHETPLFYGLFAVLIALAAGWAAGAVFRR